MSRNNSIEESSAWGEGYDAGQSGMAKAIETAEYRAMLTEKARWLNLIERQICFDSQADEDGRCSHHGGKCYELRQLIRLETE